jgi:hypothetical protein
MNPGATSYFTRILPRWVVVLGMVVAVAGELSSLSLVGLSGELSDSNLSLRRFHLDVSRRHLTDEEPEESTNHGRGKYYTVSFFGAASRHSVNP